MSRVHPGKRKHVFDAPGYATDGYNTENMEERARAALARYLVKSKKRIKIYNYHGLVLVLAGGKWVFWEAADVSLIGKDSS